MEKKIKKIAKKLKIKNFDQYGDYIAKISPKDGRYGKLILVTAINPTKFGEGKTTVSIGLADGLQKLHKKVCLALREPSLGPVFGIKGGATGGGKAKLFPSEQINLHFTGDFHAITSANNLLSACIDNHIFHGNELGFEKVTFRRCLDVNDRALREVKLKDRMENFEITSASEIMAIMCVSENLEELKRNLDNIIVGENKNGKPIYAKELNISDALVILLKEALKPNLVQTLEGTPAIVHMGPFANIAHGCNSIIATKTAMSLSDYTITEAGFGADLGAEKFLDFLCQTKNIYPDAVVLVATVRALKTDGLSLENLTKHIKNLTKIYHLPCVVALNKFPEDTKEEIGIIESTVEKLGARFAICSSFTDGGDGARALANEVVNLCEAPKNPHFAYSLSDSVVKKIEKIAKNIYGAKSVIYSDKAKEDLLQVKKLGINLPVIIAKTQYNLSDNPKIQEKNFDLHVDEIQIRNGAGFLVVICGKMLLMPALPKHPLAENLTVENLK